MSILTRTGIVVLLVWNWIAPPTSAAEAATIVADVVYGHKDGLALTFDVFKPAKPNGAGILRIQSGGWYSVWREPKELMPSVQPLLDRGFTVFLVRHGSAPKYTVPEAIEDVRRCVRFIRGRAGDYGVDAHRLGVTGGSAGGHLTLMLATTGDDGDPNAADPVLRHSSRIAAAVAFFPPTDLRGWVNNPPEAIKRIPALKPPLNFDPNKEAACSPLLHVSDATAPVLLIHGDKDDLVPLAHSTNFVAAAEKTKAVVRLLTIEGAGHAFNAQQTAIAAPALLEWFEKHLGK